LEVSTGVLYVKTLEDNVYLYVTLDDPSEAGFATRATGAEEREEEGPEVFKRLA